MNTIDKINIHSPVSIIVNIRLYLPKSWKFITALSMIRMQNIIVISVGIKFHVR